MARVVLAVPVGTVLGVGCERQGVASACSRAGGRPGLWSGFWCVWCWWARHQHHAQDNARLRVPVCVPVGVALGRCHRLWRTYGAQDPIKARMAPTGDPQRDAALAGISSKLDKLRQHNQQRQPTQPPTRTHHPRR